MFFVNEVKIKISAGFYSKSQDLFLSGSLKGDGFPNIPRRTSTLSGSLWSDLLEKLPLYILPKIVYLN